MKTKMLLAMVVVAVLGLATVLAYRKNGAIERLPLPSAPESAGSTERVTVTTTEIPRFFTNAVELDWSRVESEDYRKYIANLRAIGCPEATIRDIIVADVNKLYEARERQLARAFAPAPFWKNPRAQAAVTTQLQQRLELSREKRDVLNELLGVAVAEAAPVTLAMLKQEQRLGFLPPDKQAQVAELETAFQAKASALMAGTARPSRGELEQYRQMEAGTWAELAQVLSPQEFEEYELRNSRTAEYMRRTLGDFEMTEQEFRDVFQLRKAFDAEYGFTSSEDPRRLAAQLALDKQVSATLGEARYQEYSREQNWSTSSLRNVAQEYGLPKETAVRVFDLKPAAQEAATRVRLDAALSEELRQQALQGIQQETLKAISGILGPQAAEAYYREGSWIRSLARTQ